MTKFSQKSVFLEGEGDAWFQRNLKADVDQVASWIEQDPLGDLVENLPLATGPEISVFEVGCGQGLRLAQLNKIKGWSVAGLDPSKNAISSFKDAGYEGFVGTADALPIADNSVDLLIFGFCLYLCDRDDLFLVASEANRVLKPQSWLAIIDFWSPNQITNKYHHNSSINSYKDNFPSMFNWNPSYTITDHRLRHHITNGYTDDPHEWVATTLLRKCDSISSQLK